MIIVFFLENAVILRVKYVKILKEIVICSDIELAITNTLLNNIKFGLKKAYLICLK